jgi:hypothetical protein
MIGSSTWIPARGAWFVGLLLLAGTGCGPLNPPASHPPDAGLSDSGVSAADAGPGVDAGLVDASVPPPDAGPDAGSNEEADAGVPEDAGSEPDAGARSDAGAHPTDAGPPQADGGTDGGAAPADAGPSADAGRSTSDGGIPEDAGSSPDAGSNALDAGTPSPDAGAGCQTDSQLCSYYEVSCGTPFLLDNCGHRRTPNCGSCGTGASCDPFVYSCNCEPGYSETSSESCVVGLGQACAQGDGTAQNCPPGQVCIGFGAGVNACSIIRCESNFDCGTNGQFPNVCVNPTDGGPTFCEMECDSSRATPCGSQSDLACYPALATCGPPCAPAADECNALLYGTTCDPSSLGCTYTSCQTNSDCDADGGFVCFTDRTNPSFPSLYCVPDCRLAGNGSVCTNGRGCDSANGGCDGPADAGPG